MIDALTLSLMAAVLSVADDTWMPRSMSMPAGAPAWPATVQMAPVDWYWIVLTVCPWPICRELVMMGTSEPIVMVSPDSRTDWLARYIGLAGPSAASAFSKPSAVSEAFTSASTSSRPIWSTG